MKTKNNRGYLQSILGAIVAVSAALVLSCEQPDVSSLTAPAGKGSVVLTVSTGSPPGSAVKTILPDEQPGFSRYELVFTPKEGTVGEPVEVEVIPDELAGGLYQQELEAGTWTVKVTAYRLIASTGNGEEPGTEEAVEYKAAEGESDPFTVSAGGESPQVWVTIRPIPIADSAGLTGFFVYSVSLPSDASGTLTLTSSGGFNKTITLDVENNVVEEQQPGTGAGGSAYAYIEDSEELAAGYYDLSVELTRGGSSILAWEVVHIYAGLESWAYLGAGPEDFTRTLYLSGPIPELEGLEVGSGSGIEVYTDPNYSGKPLPVETHTSENVDAWIVGVPAADALGKTLYIKSTVVDTSGIALHYEGDTGEKTLTEAGRRDIILYPTLVGIPGGTEGTPAELPAAALNTAIAVATEAGQPVTLNNVTIVGTPPGPDEFDAVYLDGAVVTVTGKLVIPANVAVAVGGPLQPDQPVPPDQPGPLLSLSDGTGGSTGKAGDGATLNVPANATVEVSGGLLVAGTLNVTGGLDVLEGGELIVEDGASGILKGTIEVASGGVLKDQKSGGGSFWTDESTGSYIINAGAQAYSGTNVVPTIGKADDTGVLLALTSGTLTMHKDGYELTGEGALKTEGFFVTDLLIAAGSVLTIDEKGVLGAVYGEGIPGVTGEPAANGTEAAKIVVTKPNGYIDIYALANPPVYTSNISGIPHNFYTAGGTKIAKNGLTGTTYAWAADAGSADGDQPGWKASGGKVSDDGKFELPEDVTLDITLNPNEDLSWLANTELTATATEGFHSYKWILDGAEIEGQTSNELKLEAGELSVSNHTLTVVVTKEEGGAEYDKYVTFTVVFEAAE